MKKVFLKFNRIGETEDSCLSFWLKLFKNYQLYIVCDLFNVNDKIPKNLKKLTKGINVEFINSNYSLGDEYLHYVKSKKRAMASANFTCFDYIKDTDESFWIIDADDTYFIDPNFEILRKKLQNAESYLKEHELDGFSLDFYRNYNDTWTFGVCLLKSTINWKLIKDIKAEELQRYNLPGNGDSVFDVLGRLGKFKLKNFVIDNTQFRHVYNNFRKLPNSFYSWKDNKLWDMPLKSDVVVL